MPFVSGHLDPSHRGPGAARYAEALDMDVDVDVDV